MENKNLNLSASDKMYIEQARKYIKKYTNDEEKRLILEAQSGNIRAREELIKSKLYIVVNGALKFSMLNMPFDEMIQEGNETLIRFIDKYDINDKHRLTEYLTSRIHSSMRRAFVLKNYGFSTSEIEEQAYTLFKKYYDYINEYNEKPSDIVLAALLNMDVDKVKEIKNHKRRLESIEQIKEFEDEDVFGSINDEYIDEMIYDEEFANIFKSCLIYLSFNERKSIEYRLGLIDGKIYFYREIGDFLEITFQAVEQHYKNGLKKITNIIRKNYPDYYEKYSKERVLTKK